MKPKVPITSKDFVYTPSHLTNLTETFRRIRWKLNLPDGSNKQSPRKENSDLTKPFGNVSPVDFRKKP